MITIKAKLKEVPFTLEIDGKKVTYIGLNENGKIGRIQWFPPIDKGVITNLPPEEMEQWALAKNELEVYALIIFDLIKNQCEIINETRS